jgi:hypothetical protein
MPAGLALEPSLDALHLIGVDAIPLSTFLTYDNHDLLHPK